MNKKIKLMSATVLATGAMFLGTVSPALADVPVPTKDTVVIISQGDQYLPDSISVDARDQWYHPDGTFNNFMVENTTREVEPGVILGRGFHKTWESAYVLYEAYKAEVAKQNGGATTVPSTTEVVPTPAPEAPEVEAPKVETPAPEVPKTETPKVETPKVEAPKTETPKVEVKPEVPKTETPRVESKDVKVSDKKTENVPSVEEVLKEDKKAEVKQATQAQVKKESQKVAVSNTPKSTMKELPKTGDASSLLSFVGILSTTGAFLVKRNKK